MIKKCDIPSLDSRTIYGGGKATVSGIVRPITITSEIFIALCETGVWGFESRNSRQNEYKDNHEKYGARNRQGKIIVKIRRTREILLYLKKITLEP